MTRIPRMTPTTRRVRRALHNGRHNKGTRWLDVARGQRRFSITSPACARRRSQLWSAHCLRHCWFPRVFQLLVGFAVLGCKPRCALSTLHCVQLLRVLSRIVLFRGLRCLSPVRFNSEDHRSAGMACRENLNASHSIRHVPRHAMGGAELRAVRTGIADSLPPIYVLSLVAELTSAVPGVHCDPCRAYNKPTQVHVLFGALRAHTHM